MSNVSGSKNVCLTESFFSVGYIRVFARLEHSRWRLLAAFQDDEPLPVKYVSFAATTTSPMEVALGCPVELSQVDSALTPTRNHSLFASELLPSDDNKLACERMIDGFPIEN